MSTAYAWPAAWVPSQWEMRVVPNAITFTSPLNKSTQALDLLGERWRIIAGLPPGVDDRTGGALEAFFDRLRGPVNYITIGNLKRQVPLGTGRSSTAAVAWRNNASAAATWANSTPATATWARGGLVLAAAIAQLANTAVVQAGAGQYWYAGDMLGLPNGQVVRVMADTNVAGANGLITIEFLPRARSAMPAYGAVAWNYPTTTFRLAADGVPVAWRPGNYEGASLELIEVI